MTIFRAVVSLVFCLCFVPFSGCTTTKTGAVTGGGGSSSINDTARFLAGLPGSNRGDLALGRNSPEWKSHQQQMDRLWNQYLARRSHLGGFRSQIGGLASPGVLFYPFGGPDYIYSNALFPGARNYVLVGLEGVDAMPDLGNLSASEIRQGLGGVAKSLRTVSEASYFVTREMRVDLQSTRFRGALPLLLVEAARNGQSIQYVTAVGIDGAGNLTSRATGSACPGWHIRAGGRNIFYFRKDLSNGGLGDRRLLKFVTSRGSVTTFVKSASYLMHQGSFSMIRNFILNQTSGLVQGPSGVPFHDIVEAGWNIKLFGNYQGAAAPFESHSQPDLATAYRDGSYPVKPLSFGIGYQLRAERACIIVARRH